MSDPIHIQADATTAELMSAAGQFIKTAFAGWRRSILIISSLGRALVIFVVGGAIILIPLNLMQTGAAHANAVAVLWPFLVFLLAYPFIIVRSRMIYGFAARSRFGNCGDYTIDANGIEAITPGGELRIHWHGVEAVHETRKLIVLVYGTMFMVLPKRCFPSAEAASEAADQMRRWHAEALS